MTVPQGQIPESPEKHDPFAGCVVQDCTAPLEAPIDLFCERHYLIVPAQIRHDLETEIDKRDYDRARWHALVQAATTAAAAASSCRGDR